MAKLTYFFLFALLGYCVAIPLDNNDNKEDLRIVGGSPAEEGEFPYQVSMRGASNSHFCGGVLITTRTVLTAAHCLTGRLVSGTFAWLGTTLLSSGGDRYSLGDIRIHPDFNRTTFENDVALGILSINVATGGKVRPVDLEYENIGGDVDVILSGWGRNSTEGLVPDELQKVTLKTLTLEDCRTRMSVLGEIYDSSLCTLTKAGEGACQGASGGPLVAAGKLVGIVSWGSPCARGIPDVSARISSLAQWIDANKI